MRIDAPALKESKIAPQAHVSIFRSLGTVSTLDNHLSDDAKLYTHRPRPLRVNGTSLKHDATRPGRQDSGEMIPLKTPGRD